MGRLKLRPSQKHLLLTARWLPSVTIAVAIVFFAHVHLFAHPKPDASDLTSYLKTDQLVVGNETVNDYQQVYYIYKDQKIFITKDVFNHTNARSSGQYIVWEADRDGGDQVFLYDLLSGSTIQLSSYGTNQQPRLSGNRVVWQAWIGSNWQVFYYDGSSTKQISSEFSSSRPDIYQNQVAYAQVIGDKQWQVVSYDTASSQTKIIKTGDETVAWPHFIDGKLKTTR